MGSNEKELASCEIHLYMGTELPMQYGNLVRSRWRRTYRQCNDFMRLIERAAYQQAYTHYVNAILNRPDTEVRLAVLSDDADVVLGFSVSEGRVLHYVHVPKDYRKNGIGKSLLPNKVEWFTHITTTGLNLWPRLIPSAKFNPFI